MKIILSCLFILSTFIAAVAQKPVTIGSLRLIGVHDIPHNLSYKGTTVGGLSGIDYDSERDQYYMISDDRSAINPARYYTAKIFFDSKKIDSVSFVNVTPLLARDGNVYPNSKQDPAHAPDPEALRYNAITKQMIWSSEGERIVKANDIVLENPAITIISPEGKYIDTFPLPQNLMMSAKEKGPRQNGVLEGLTFADKFTKLYVSLEEPLYEDGPRADTVPNDAFVRIYEFDMASKQNMAQYAYKLDPIAFPAIPSNAFKVNGIPDILSVGNKQFLVLERSFSTGRLPCTIKIFLADLGGATDISKTASLKEHPAAKAATKTLLLNMDELGMYIDNVEGITFGPDLPNGHKTLVLVADNNFAVLEKTQFFLFEIMPPQKAK